MLRAAKSNEARRDCVRIGRHSARRAEREFSAARVALVAVSDRIAHTRRETLLDLTLSFASGVRNCLFYVWTLTRRTRDGEATAGHNLRP
jgi:hypothetical protein